MPFLLLGAREDMNQNHNPSIANMNDLFESLKRIETKIMNAVGRTPIDLQPGFMSLKKAASYSDLSEKSIRRFISAGRLQAYRPARGKILVKRTELDALIEKSTKQIRKGRGIRR